MISIPLSRFKREMNGILNKLDKGVYSVIYITINKKEIFVLTSVGYYENMTSLVDNVV